MNHIAFLGGGNMATAIITGMIQKGGFLPAQISVIEHNERNAHRWTTTTCAMFQSLASAHAQLSTTPDVGPLSNRKICTRCSRN